MPLPSGHPAPTGGHHPVRFRMRAREFGRADREFDVHATPEELKYFDAQGFLVRERLLQGELLDRLRAATDEVVAREGKSNRLSTGKAYGGVFLRHLMDKHEAFLDLAGFDPVISVARAMLGPLTYIRGCSARVSYPGEGDQQTEWHYHQRVLTEPLAPWFMPPQFLDVLLYLDDTNEANGRLCVVPGSHRFLDRDLPPDAYDDRPDQVALDLPAGSVVFTHGNIWHRATPTTARGSIRRLLIWGFGPTWLREGAHGAAPADGLVARKLAGSTDPLLRELLGRSGWL